MPDHSRSKRSLEWGRKRTVLLGIGGMALLAVVGVSFVGSPPPETSTANVGTTESRSPGPMAISTMSPPTPTGTAQPRNEKSSAEPRNEKNPATDGAPIPPDLLGPKVRSTPVSKLPSQARSSLHDSVATYVTEAAVPLTDDPDIGKVELTGIATGPAREAIMASVAEFSDNGWHQEGAPALLDTTVVEYDKAASPPTATIHACVDSSDVQVVTSEGLTVNDTGPDRVLNIIKLVKKDGRWLTQQISFPNNPRC